jgi:hypothetical protein
VCRPYRSPWGAFPVTTFPCISTAAAVEVGIVVTYSTGTAVGGVVQPAVLPSTANGTAPVMVVGVTAEKSSAFASSAVLPLPISIYEANPMVEFKAVTKGAALGSSSIGLRRAIGFDSTLRIAYIDMTASTAADWRVIVTKVLGPMGAGGVVTEGDSGGYVAFRFLQKLEGSIGSSVAITSTSPLLAFFG